MNCNSKSGKSQFGHLVLGGNNMGQRYCSHGMLSHVLHPNLIQTIWKYSYFYTSRLTSITVPATGSPIRTLLQFSIVIFTITRIQITTTNLTFQSQSWKVLQIQCWFKMDLKSYLPEVTKVAKNKNLISVSIFNLNVGMNQKKVSKHLFHYW